MKDLSYQELVDKAKAAGIETSNVKKEDLIKQLQDLEDKKVEEKKAEDKKPEDKKVEKSKEKKVESSDVTFETTKKVEFQIDSVKFEGTKFTFPKDIVESRKKTLTDAYGKDIIKE